MWLLSRLVSFPLYCKEIMKENSRDFVRILMAILVPPLGVFLQVGWKTQFWINIVLTLLGYIPGIIHGIYIILSRSDSPTSRR